MLATITLAADNDWVGVWIGSTLGMVAADALAILVGAIAGKHLPERLIQIVAAALFLLFGVFMLLENIFPGGIERHDRRQRGGHRPGGRRRSARDAGAVTSHGAAGPAGVRGRRPCPRRCRRR